MFGQVPSLTKRLENDLNQIKNKIERTKFVQTDEIKIANAEKMFEDWSRLGKIYHGVDYYHQMLNQCQLKLDNLISMNEFYENIVALVNKSNEKFRFQRFHIRHVIDTRDKQDLFNILFKS